MFLGYGASLGGVILLKMVENKKIHFEKCIFEGCSLWEHVSLLEFVLKRVFIWKHRKALKDNKLAIEKITKLYGKRAGIAMSNTFIQMSEQSIKNIIHDCSNVNIPKLAMEKMNLI